MLHFSLEAANFGSFFFNVQRFVLWNSVLIMTMLAFAIVFLMTVKLAMVGSIIALVVAVILGLIFANMLLRRATITFPVPNKKSSSIN